MMAVDTYMNMMIRRGIVNAKRSYGDDEYFQYWPKRPRDKASDTPYGEMCGAKNRTPRLIAPEGYMGATPQEREIWKPFLKTFDKKRRDWIQSYWDEEDAKERHRANVLNSWKNEPPRVEVIIHTSSIEGGVERYRRMYGDNGAKRYEQYRKDREIYGC